MHEEQSDENRFPNNTIRDDVNGVVVTRDCTSQPPNYYQSRERTRAAQPFAGSRAADFGIALSWWRVANKRHAGRDAAERSMDEHDNSFPTRERRRGDHRP